MYFSYLYEQRKMRGDGGRDKSEEESRKLVDEETEDAVNDGVSVIDDGSVGEHGQRRRGEPHLTTVCRDGL